MSEHQDNGMLRQPDEDDETLMTQSVKAAAIQMASGPNVDANLLEAKRLIRHAVDDGASMIVLPENFAFMGQLCSEMVTIAEHAGEGKIQNFLSQQARELGVWIVGGTLPLTTSNGDRVRSACLVFDDTGQQVGRYDKIHLFDVQLVEANEEYSESRAIEPGDEPLVIDTPMGRLGIAICYDLRFPELFRAMVDQGAEIIAIPSAFTAVTGKAHWNALVRARAIENLCYIIASAQGGFHVSGRETHGHSMIVDPWGTVLGELGKGGGSVAAMIDRGFLQSTRQAFPSLTHRRLQCTTD